MGSILASVKKTLPMAEDCTHFDDALIMHINSVLMVLTQVGVGTEYFIVKDDTTTWEEFIPDNQSLEIIKSYVALKVRLLFDPPTNPSMIDVFKQAIDEFEWRISIEVDPGPKEKEEEG